MRGRWLLVSSSSSSSSSSRSSTGTIGVAVVATLAVFRAAVPARAFGHFLSELAHLSLCVEHVALGTTKLVWLLVVITGEVVLAVCGVRRWGGPAAGSGVQWRHHLQD